MNEYRTTNERTGGLRNVFRALRSRNYRLFFVGQGISLIGTWMQTIAMSWLVYRLTGSAFLLGVVGFSSQFPVFIFAALAGVFVDRHNRHKILLLTQSLALDVKPSGYLSESRCGVDYVTTCDAFFCPKSSRSGSLYLRSPLVPTR